MAKMKPVLLKLSTENKNPYYYVFQLNKSMTDCIIFKHLFFDRVINYPRYVILSKIQK